TPARVCRAGKFLRQNFRSCWRAMRVFEVVIALLIGGAVLSALARRIGAPYPALVALAGAALALVPRLPTLVLDPELARGLLGAPVPGAGALRAPPRAADAGARPRAGAGPLRRARPGRRRLRRLAARPAGELARGRQPGPG